MESEFDSIVGFPLDNVNTASLVEFLLLALAMTWRYTFRFQCGMNS